MLHISLNDKIRNQEENQGKRYYGGNRDQKAEMGWLRSQTGQQQMNTKNQVTLREVWQTTKKMGA